MSRRTALAAPCAALFVIGATVAAAQQTIVVSGPVDRPFIAGNLFLQFELDKNVAGPSGTGYDPNGYIAHSPLSAALFLNRDWSVQTTLFLDQVQTPTSAALLQGQGLYLQQAFVNYDDGRLIAFAGKFNPEFGIFWAMAPGVYGKNLTIADYWLTEGIGAGAGLSFAGIGRDQVRLSAWFKDNTALSTSLFDRPPSGSPTTTRPGRLRLGDGGVGNTPGPTSLTLSWRAQDVAGLPGLQTNLDLASLDHGDNGTRRQTMIAAGVQYLIPLGGDWSVAPIAEYVGMWNQGGAAGGIAQDRIYASAGATLTRGAWQASAVWGLRNTQDGPTSPRNRLYTASIGYTFANGIGLQAGVARQVQSGANLDTVGGLVTYGYSF